jgi:hypothetical protein
MDPGFRSPLVDFFRRGEVARDVRLLAAQGALAPRAHEQLALLVLLSDDPDREIAAATAATLDALPEQPLRAFIARSDVPDAMRRFFTARGLDTTGVAASDTEAPLIDTLAELAEVPDSPDGSADDDRKLLSSLPVIERMKLAMKGTREQRAQLVRDSNRLVAAAVLSSPKLTESEVEAFTKMGNVSEEVLRTIGTNRAWTKNYGVLAGLCRHPKTPPAMSMQMLHRLNERDLKNISIDRNVPEVLRQLSRKILTKTQFG